MIIKELYVNNFKSLVNFKLSDLDICNVIYGNNNAGKSNILEFLYLLFQRKRLLGEDGLTEDPRNFYEGIIEDFNHCFYNNEFKSNIDFSVKLQLTTGESNFDSKANDLGLELNESGEQYIEIEGNISILEENPNLGNMEVSEIRYNGCSIYRFIEDSIRFFPDAKLSHDQSTLRKSFELMIEPLNDCVYLIQRKRDVLQVDFKSDVMGDLSPDTFKKFLYNISLSLEDYHLFEEINSMFNDEPFSFGELSFSRINEFLEIMIKKDGIRLPINSMGSGVIQILFIISSIIKYRPKIICIEELEQNLSPTMQMETLTKLKSIIELSDEFSQLIISSHSENFYSTKISDSIYLIQKREGQTYLAARASAKDEKLDVSYFKDHFPDVEDWY